MITFTEVLVERGAFAGDFPGKPEAVEVIRKNEQAGIKAVEIAEALGPLEAHGSTITKDAGKDL